MTGKSVRSVVICSASLGCVGIITTLIGLLFILLAQKEVRPPYYDAEYTRHVGSNLPLIIGPLAVVSGLFTIMGNIIFLCYVCRRVLITSELSRSFQDCKSVYNDPHKAGMSSLMTSRAVYNTSHHRESARFTPTFEG